MSGLVRNGAVPYLSGNDAQFESGSPSGYQGAAMRLARRLSAVSVAATLMLGLGPPVEAAAAKKDFVRHADDSCRNRRGEYYVCAPWRLYLRSGRVIRLTEARVFTGSGVKSRAPFALSPHGSTAAYFRLKDNALVVRDVTTGKVRVVPGITWSATRRFMIDISPGGRFIILDRGYPQPYQILDSVSGRVHTLPAGQIPVSFSPDNEYLLTRQQEVATVYSTETWAVVRVRQGAQGGALHMDGTTVAYIDRSNRQTHYIRFLNLATGGTAGSPIKLPPGEFGGQLYWDRANHLDVLATVTAASRGDRTTWRWRRANDAMRVLDTFVERSLDEIDVIAGLWYL
ncbi:hypothetical protein [Nonomuraea sp. SYSU D8015]|uniref:hypothetical protein n=1 Tax=Nonomuraea sp. SYSU D8015 TaxID=2593644 RepID=UPI001660371B|nr:hypothetical protein [Nonomuraea sp. SYSU D8015]